MIVKFFFKDSAVKLTERRRLKLFLSQLFELEKTQGASLTYVFCSDEYLLAINREFLQHNTYTDIITFRLSDNGEPVNGEIYISTDRVFDNARNLGVNSNHELHRVIFHGALHLCGLNDKKQSERKIMRSTEDKYLKMYFNVPRIPVP